MRTIAPIAVALIIAAILQLSSSDISIGQELTTDEVRHETSRQWTAITRGRPEFDIADPALVPSQLALTASRSGCRWKDVIKDVPVHVFKIDDRRFAKVTRFGFGHFQQIYDLSQPASPRVLEFPVMSSSEGFRTTSFLG